MIPNPDLFDAWADCIRDFGAGARDGSGDWQVAGLGPDRASFAALLQVIRVESDPGSGLPVGHVHGDYFWLTDDAEIVGFLALRHSIDNDFLRTLGGHIGYSVRPSRRRQGHASRALGLALDRAGERGMDRVLLTCDVDNVASARTIESQGGQLEGTLQDKKRYWIPVPSRA